MAQAIARGEDQKRYEAEIASLVASLRVCHAEIAAQARLIGTLRGEIGRGRGEPYGDVEV